VLPKKLTPGEIKSVVEKIRKKYDEYTTKYFKPKSLRDSFEKRYISALGSRVDISSFLLAEISAIEELTQREDERLAAGAAKATEEKHVDFADKVLEENRKKIEKYPDAPVHKDAGMEVRKLLGALNFIEQECWPELSFALRNTAYSMTSSEMLALDSRLRALSSLEKDGTPVFLTRYMAQLRKFPRNYSQIEREEKEYILESAFLLNDLVAILDRVKRLYQDLNEEEARILDKVVAYVWGIITDFRLKEFRKKKEWEREERS
jgi:hypothetical protein